MSNAAPMNISPPPHPAVEVYLLVVIGSRFIPPPDPFGENKYANDLQIQYIQDMRSKKKIGFS